MPAVREIMDTRIPTVKPEDRVETVVHLMADQELPAVPVVNDGGRCVGIVTESDLVIGDDERDLRLPHMISLFGGVVFLEPLSRFEERLRKAAAADVEDMMTADPITVDAAADVREAARIMADKKHNRLPVVEHGRYVGLVSRAEVLETLAGL
ncbi:MAG TPA: CBS domain-containing protein [Solirubrobacteraceae bacterium]|jgi:CBS domain-containing protein|nr:CBS domain-containing protein [Solirubrobacteraceae bacterium]